MLECFDRFLSILCHSANGMNIFQRMLLSSVDKAIRKYFIMFAYIVKLLHNYYYYNEDSLFSLPHACFY